MDKYIGACVYFGSVYCVCERRPKMGKRCKRNDERSKNNRMFGCCLFYFLLHSSYLMGLNEWTIYKGCCCSNSLLQLYDCCCHCYRILSLCHCNQKVKYIWGEKERERKIALTRITAIICVYITGFFFSQFYCGCVAFVSWTHFAFNPKPHCDYVCAIVCLAKP